VGLQDITGAASRLDPATTASPHRCRKSDFLILSQGDNPAESAPNVEWTRQSYEAMRSFLKEAVYMNNLGEEGMDRVRAAFGANYDRRVAVKAKYDPGNFFRLNQNVAPARAV
jgi:hypothetical protein